MKDDYTTNSRLCIFSLKGWENGLFELRSERVKETIADISNASPSSFTLMKGLGSKSQLLSLQQRLLPSSTLSWCTSLQTSATPRLLSLPTLFLPPWVGWKKSLGTRLACGEGGKRKSQGWLKASQDCSYNGWEPFRVCCIFIASTNMQLLGVFTLVMTHMWLPLASSSSHFCDQGRQSAMT